MAMTTYYNPGGFQGNPMNNNPLAGGVYRNPGGYMGNPLNMGQPSYQLTPAQAAVMQTGAPSSQPAASTLQKYRDATAAAMEQSLKANQARYNAALGQVGLDENYQQAQQPAEQSKSNYWSIHDVAPDLQPPTYDMARGSPGARRIALSNVARGISNSSFAQGKEGAAQTADEFDAMMRTWQAKMGLYTNQQAQSQRDVEQGNIQQQRRLDLLKEPVDRVDYSQAAQLATQYGAGTNDGMGGAGIGGGGYFGGGPAMAANNPFSLPMSQGYWGGGGRSQTPDNFGVPSPTSYGISGGQIGPRVGSSIAGPRLTAAQRERANASSRSMVTTEQMMRKNNYLRS